MKRIFFFLILMSVTLVSCKTTVETPKPAWFPTTEAAYDNQLQLFAEFPLNETNVVFAGGSLIADGNWQELYSNKSIINRGIKGEGTEGLIYRAASIASAHPQKIFIQSGLEDLERGESAEVVSKRIAKVFQILSDVSPNSSLYFVGYYSPDSNSEVIALNKLVEKGAKSYKYVDIQSAFDVDENLLANSFDENGDLTILGYSLMAAKLNQDVALEPEPVSSSRAIVMMGGDVMTNIDWVEAVPVEGIVDRTKEGSSLASMSAAMDEYKSGAPGKVFVMPSRAEVSSIETPELWNQYKDFITKFVATYPNTQLYILGPVPYGTASQNYGDGSFNSKLIELNKLIEASQSKYNFLFLDPATVLADESGALKNDLTYDGENLNVDGVFTFLTMLLQGPRMLVLNPDALLK